MEEKAWREERGWRSRGRCLDLEGFKGARRKSAVDDETTNKRLFV